MKYASRFIAPVLCWILSMFHTYAQPAFGKKQPVFIEGIELTSKAPAQKSISDSGNPSSFIHLSGNPVSETESPADNYSSLQFKYAQLLDMELEKITNLRLYNLIDNWMHTRYRYGGSSRSGIDCSGFTGMIYRNIFDITLPRMASEQYLSCDKISREELQEGDLVFFSNKKYVSHVGMYLGNQFFVHSSTKEGVTISSLNEDYYSRKFYGCGRVTKTQRLAQFQFPQ